MRLSRLFSEFFVSEKAGGMILLLVTLCSLFLANSHWQLPYLNFWKLEIAHHTLVHWINDGLMTIFFLLIGLELKREVYQGELSNFKNAALPLFGALGGMLVPAAIFLLFNSGTTTQNGAGIPMATDIAFAIAILSLLGNKVPASLKVFLTALAVIDDLGAILVIALFYSATIDFFNLLYASGLFMLLLTLNRLKINNLIPYILGGIAMWFCMLNSGVHATITGVLLAFAIPFRDGSVSTPSYKLQHFLHQPVAFVVLPLFAMANTCLPIYANWSLGLTTTCSLGIILGLVIGKPLGIFVFSWIGQQLKICALPTDLKWKNIIGAGMLGGIGFTMSIFVTLLAFTKTEQIEEAKIAILFASFCAGTIGYLFLKSILNSTTKSTNTP